MIEALRHDSSSAALLLMGLGVFFVLCGALAAGVSPPGRKGAAFAIGFLLGPLGFLACWLIAHAASTLRDFRDMETDPPRIEPGPDVRPNLWIASKRKPA